MDNETTQEQIKISVFTPFIYLAIMGGIFFVFAHFYKQKRLAKLAKIEPIFEDNFPLRLYLNLKETAANSATKPDENLVKAALLRRGAEAVRRSMKLKENEAAFQRLYQEGLIGDEVFKQFEFETKFQELELKEIVQEVESIKPGWAQTFFPTAQEVCFNEALRRRLYAIDNRKSDLEELWKIESKEGVKEKDNKEVSEKEEDNKEVNEKKVEEKVEEEKVDKEEDEEKEEKEEAEK